MKFPSLPLAVSVAAGILIGGKFALRLPHAPRLFLAACFIFLLLGFFLLASRRVVLAGVASLLAWSLLGAAAIQLPLLAVPANHVTKVFVQQGLDSSGPLRWRGSLRDDPLLLPWGMRYDIDLTEVESMGNWQSISGGMRIDYYTDERTHENPPPLRAGDRVEALLQARQPRNFGDPGAFDNTAFLANQGLYLTATLRNAALLQRLPGGVPSLAQRVRRLRGRLLQQLDAMLAASPAEAAVARAMLLGDRSFVDREQADRFQQTGSYHVLVLAGLHVGVLAMLLLWTGRKLRVPLATSTLGTLLILGAYVAIVEDRPLILRAWLMIAIYLLGRMMFRRTHPLNALGIAAMIILAFQPAALRDASFLLSFMAVGAIAGIAAPLFERTSHRYRRALLHLGDATRDGSHVPHVTQFRLDARAAVKWLDERFPPSLSRYAGSVVTLPCHVLLRLWEIVILTMVIQIGILPLMALYFHRITLVAPVANIPAVLLTGIVMPLGFLALAASFFWGALGHALGSLLAVSINLLTASVNWFAGFFWASYRVPSPPLQLHLAFVAILILCSAAIIANKRWAMWASGLALLVLTTLIALHPFSPRLNSGNLEVTVLDVGQGDSIFVASPDGRTMLVDGGGLPGGNYVRGMRAGLDVGEDVVSPYLWARGLKRLDVVALTHAHEDHIGGLAAVLRNFRVGELWVGHDVDSAVYRALLDEARARNVRVVHQLRGNSFDWDGVQVHVLWPDNDDAVKAAGNDDSLVLSLQQGSETLLLTGDIERPIENALLADHSVLSADFLKVPHHGSRTSTTPNFLDAVHPKFAAISVGTPNAYGHPNTDVIDRIDAEGSQVYRTDRDGAITTLTDGHSMEVQTFLAHR